ncbi:MAG: S8/S53 family peptidase [Xanthomonadales bacterium]|nr:S8/S53 family peptidase [Xanthomonadales bacterium]
MPPPPRFVDAILEATTEVDGLPFSHPKFTDPALREAGLARALADLAEFDENQVRVMATYPLAGAARLRVSPAFLASFRPTPTIKSILAIPPATQLLGHAVGVANFAPLHSQGLTGGGIKVAVIDAAVNAGASLVEEHCWCTHPIFGVGCCSNGQHQQSGPGAAQSNGGVAGDAAHGALVAAVLGANTAGAAPSVGIVGIATDTTAGVADALYYLSSRPDIPIINLSFEYGGNFPGSCDAASVQGPAIRPLVNLLYQQGKSVVAAAGNNNRLESQGMPAMGFPACLSSTIAVTGHWGCFFDGKNKNCDDPIASLSTLWRSTPSFGADASSMTDLAATAAPITGLAAQALAGTSYSAPLAAGCAALLKQGFPGATVEQIRSALSTSSISVTRPGHAAYPRLNCGQAHAWLALQQGTRINQHGITGNYYNPSTPGQGLQLEVFPDSNGPGQGYVMGGWFTFDTVAGGVDRQRWFTVEGVTASASASSVDVTILTRYNGSFAQGPEPSALIMGTGTLSFDNCNEAALAFDLQPPYGSGQIPLVPLLPNISCTPQGGGGGHNDYRFSGNWYTPAFGGQGLMLEVNPTEAFVFGLWFTFRPAGQPGSGPASQRWLSLQRPYSPGTRSIQSIPVGETLTSGAFNASTPIPGLSQVGTANLEFHSCSSATLDYSLTSGTFAGQSGSLPLTRLGPVPAGCVY